ncbi:haloacid dehalogenase-like hydrolase [Luedemannella flava]|uniref:Haloacid dehalogenase-like hydrolase n=1 Tax=Luedemannella flava TaxID=349316 RepID=A0ABN2LM71_9ACTN
MTDRLVLWDIDRTLIKTGGVTVDIFRAAFREVTGEDLTHLPDLGGRTDHDLITEALTAQGIAPDEALIRQFFVALTEGLRSRRDDIVASGCVLPGAGAALAAFAEVPKLVQSVVTGNVRETAYEKLSMFGLTDRIDFAVGGYGCDDGRRATLVRLAVERASQAYGRGYAGDRVIVIGDTPHDIVGAHANGVRAIGVATGRSTTDDLVAAGADMVLASLVDTDAVLRAALGT